MKKLTSLTKPKFSPLFLIIFVVAVYVVILITLHFFWKSWTHQLYLVTYQSPLPDVIVAERKKTTKPYLKNYDFSMDMFTENIPVWEKALEPFKGKANVNYLEVGVYEGGSLVWMLENILTEPTAKITAIDVEYKPKYYTNIELSGSSDKVTAITDYSQIALRKLPFDSFDIIYIDGSHVECDVLEDAVLSWRLLKIGGILIFDDYRRILKYVRDRRGFPKAAIDPFAQCFEKQLEVIHNEYQLIMRRIK